MITHFWFATYWTKVVEHPGLGRSKWLLFLSYRLKGQFSSQKQWFNRVLAARMLGNRRTQTRCRRLQVWDVGWLTQMHARNQSMHCIHGILEQNQWKWMTLHHPGTNSDFWRFSIVYSNSCSKGRIVSPWNPWKFARYPISFCQFPRGLATNRVKSSAEINQASYGWLL